MTIWDWLAQVNAEGGTGFAKYSDWRIPNVRELLSIVDYGTVVPVVAAAFNTGCIAGCTVLTCSCPSSFWNWSSTTGPNQSTYPNSALAVEFTYGQVSYWNNNKSDYSFGVRAVRGGCINR